MLKQFSFTKINNEGVITMQIISKENNLYKSITKNGYTDFPNISARVLYYEDDGIEYAITINLSTLTNVMEIEQFE